MSQLTAECIVRCVQLDIMHDGHEAMHACSTFAGASRPCGPKVTAGGTG